MAGRIRRLTDHEQRLIVVAAIVAFSMTAIYDVVKITYKAYYPNPLFEAWGAVAALCASMIFVFLVFRRQLFGLQTPTEE